MKKKSTSKKTVSKKSTPKKTVSKKSVPVAKQLAISTAKLEAWNTLVKLYPGNSSFKKVRDGVKKTVARLSKKS